MSFARTSFGENDAAVLLLHVIPLGGVVYADIFLPIRLIGFRVGVLNQRKITNEWNGWFLGRQLNHSIERFGSVFELAR
jgi:hypothetical protein